MIFSTNTSSISLIEAELKRLKGIYRKSLETNNVLILKDVRRKIKVLQARSHIMRDCTINLTNGSRKS